MFVMMASGAAAARSTGVLFALNSSNTYNARWTREQPLSIQLIHKAHSSFSSPLYLTHCYPDEKPGSHQSTSEQSSDQDSTSIAYPNSQKPFKASGKELPLSPSSFSRGLVFDLGLNQSWDGHDVGSPVVKRYVSDEKERWFMWYHGDDAIGLALSNNGIHWERGTGAVESAADAGEVMRRSTDWWAFDTHSVRPSDVLIMSSSKLRASNAVYWLYYTGFGPEKSLPGLAMSQDGRHWARIEGEHHSGALLDVGAAGQWDSAFIASPKVVYHGRNDFRMYYHSLDEQSGEYAIGVARSRDGMKWVKLGKVLAGSGVAGSFDEAGVLHGHVVRDKEGGGYLMAYEGVAIDGRRSIGMVASGDGLNGWRRCSGKMVLMPDMDGWDCEGVGEPYLVPMDEQEGSRLYYRGVGSSERAGIGLAVCQTKRMSKFDRWSGFQL
ncbi:uncharacterized protein LOC110109299 [Dendrobium catenatum]|nr:uncharacterized protein LOC110109299 [Dendrobium catenatum]XP_020695958.1 uncharacterized protein LOC110109299 [Dendrobium catenatum]XP_020695960.1 uncharacterized protein LOC110109299 [Dendrobium catenatum]XP_028555704.1 uncharacterized protein LOC110109299 [Dendrobium catenatum]XP_028555705.1 uncharacterized protein LOC110109299 [Dendrobium catenatum]XP_028555706.1 uncharacterized protein LOC110109299 [Dendrobium catenatum]XP_028555707.1 uncharacterized protein LOC110109299 [Dendrobium c